MQVLNMERQCPNVAMCAHNVCSMNGFMHYSVNDVVVELAVTFDKTPLQTVTVLISTLWFKKKNAPTLADYNYDPIQSILIIFSKLFVNDHKSCLVVKFSTSPHMCCHYLVKHNALFCTNYTAYRKKCANFGSP